MRRVPGSLLHYSSLQPVCRFQSSLGASHVTFTHHDLSVLAGCSSGAVSAEGKAKGACCCVLLCWCGPVLLAPCWRWRFVLRLLAGMVNYISLHDSTVIKKFEFHEDRWGLAFLGFVC